MCQNLLFKFYIGKFYHISCNTVLFRLLNSVNPLCSCVCLGVRLAKYNAYRYLGCIIDQSNWSGPFSLVVMTPD